MSAVKPGIPVMSVYASWLRINLSKHQYCGSATSGVPQKEWLHVEVSNVRGLVGPFQKFSPPTVRFDGQRFAMFAHDVGPFVPHICQPPDNAMLAVTMMKSKCKWPFSASRGNVGKRVPCVFKQGRIPYVYCDERAKKEENKKKKEQGGQGAAKPASPKGAKGSEEGKEDKEDKRTTFKEQAPTLGLIMIPAGPQTVNWHLGLMDLVLGAANMLVDFAFDYVWKRYEVLTGKSLQKHVARRLAARMGGSAAAEKAFEDAIGKIVKDYAKGMASRAELRAPLKLAKLDLKTGKITVWTSEVGDAGWKLTDTVPFDFKGWMPFVDPGSPVLDDLIGDVLHAH